MTRNRLLFFALSVALVLPLVTGTFLAASAREGGEDDSLYKYLAVFTEVLTRVRDHYVDSTDVDALIEGALDGTSDALDPFSLYVPAEAVEPYQAAREVGSSLSGLVLLKDRGLVYVAGVERGSPGAKAGFEVGDVLSEIGGESTRTMPLWRAQQMLAGPQGTEVTVETIRRGEAHEASLTLAPFDPPRPSLEERRGVGVLRIPGFGAPTVAAVESALADAAAARRDRLVVDLRAAAAGDAEVAYEVAALFTAGELGSLKRRDAAVATFASDEEPRWQGRLVVLVNRGTLGAAEVLATVLKQKLDATLVGERTFGYAGRQQMAQLSSGGRLLYTEAFYSGPDGEPLRDSLVPDLRVDDRGGLFAESGEDGADPILERGLEVILGEAEVPARAAA